jgi:hypothetical protein
VAAHSGPGNRVYRYRALVGAQRGALRRSIRPACAALAGSRSRPTGRRLSVDLVKQRDLPLRSSRRPADPPAGDGVAGDQAEIAVAGGNDNRACEKRRRAHVDFANSAYERHADRAGSPRMTVGRRPNTGRISGSRTQTMVKVRRPGRQPLRFRPACASGSQRKSRAGAAPRSDITS